MATNYANEKLTAAIENHLLRVDAIPPGAEMSKLAGELALICVAELNTAGLGNETIENLFAPSALKARARGVE